jgi:phenylalanine-4-hydroxylase
MSPAVQRLPKHLRSYIVEQDYSKYTPVEHATWRYIMRQNCAFFKDHAVPIYLQGLKDTGIPTDRVPNIKEMDDALSRFGYGAVGVCGFIPPAIFLEFQALGIMPIATDMRTLDHASYTPAPDIVHEAAGHVPVVADTAYRRYLSHYGKIAHKAIFSTEDVRMYEAIRLLSDIKENPDTKPEEIQKAQNNLNEASAAVTFVSESTKVGRMGWWTIEYGLVGDIKNPKIYGAGLLSSVGESQNCLNPEVRKIPLTVHCVEQSFDITEPQPQLFIAPSLDDLPTSLKELESTMSYVRGGAFGLGVAKQAKTVNTIELDSGLQCSGVVESFITEGDDVVFFKLAGPCQLAVHEDELEGQSKSEHPHGFSSPIGRWKRFPDRAPHLLGESELQTAGVVVGKTVRLELCSGFVIEGIVASTTREDGALVSIAFDNCKVTRGGTTYFAPDWGRFDMAVGSVVRSVFSGPADRDAFGNYDIGRASTSPGRQSPFSNSELEAFKMHERIRNMRSRNDLQSSEATVLEVCESALTKFKDSWLVLLESAELCHQFGAESSTVGSVRSRIEKELTTLAAHSSPVVKTQIEKGLKIAHFIQ